MERVLSRWLLASAMVVLAISGAAAEPPSSDKLWVVVENLQSDRGQIRIALWRGPQGFTSAKAAVEIRAASPNGGLVQFEFAALPPGRYAVAVYHDENANGQMDTNWLGWPVEGLGFSNGVWINRGRPSFEAAAIELPRASEPVFIALRY